MLNPDTDERDLYNFLRGQENKSGFLKKLLRQELERERAEDEKEREGTK